MKKQHQKFKNVILRWEMYIKLSSKFPKLYVEVDYDYIDYLMHL